MKKPHLNTKPDGYQGGRKSAEGVSTSTTDSRKRGAMGGNILDVLQSSPSSSLSVVQVGTLPKFLDQWGIITSSRFMLNMVKGHHL